jgi:hypothetical protein
MGIAEIALSLGHEGIDTTRRYLQSDLAMTERALKQPQPIGDMAEELSSRYNHMHCTLDSGRTG